jgi:hypothetical protein
VVSYNSQPSLPLGAQLRPLFKGFHPFQVFVIFPIHANPWTSLCKKMVERQDTQFQPNTLFTYTGKVAGFLNHHIMVHPPQLTEDRAFIVVPNTWTFFDKGAGRAYCPRRPLQLSNHPRILWTKLNSCPHQSGQLSELQSQRRLRHQPPDKYPTRNQPASHLVVSN